MCFPAKLFESLIYGYLFNHVKLSISSKQHGFLPLRSTVSNLICISQYLADSLDRRKQVDAVYTDLTKAFDRLNHKKLILKLRLYGISDSLILWFDSYLSNREMYVCVNNFKSGIFCSGSGVPQGSNLGPLLFLIYFNDIVECVMDSEVLSYADDLKLFRVITSPNDCIMLQNDLNRVSNWCEINSLAINISKCKVVSYYKSLNPLINHYTVNSTTLERSSEIKDLGVWFDSKLTFSTHITSIVTSATKLLGLFLEALRCFTIISH